MSNVQSTAHNIHWKQVGSRQYIPLFSRLLTGQLDLFLSVPKELRVASWCLLIFAGYETKYHYDGMKSGDTVSFQ